MLHINCPFCGLRAQKEFAYGGDATVKRPEINKEISKEEWDNFVYMRKSPRGKHIELCLLYTSPSPRDREKSRMPSSA